MLYLFNQSEDFTMIKLKLTSSHLCAHDAPCERSGWTSLIQHGEKKEEKKRQKSLRGSFLLRTMKGFSHVWGFLCITSNTFIWMSKTMRLFFRWNWIHRQELTSWRDRWAPSCDGRRASAAQSLITGESLSLICVSNTYNALFPVSVPPTLSRESNLFRWIMKHEGHSRGT